MPLTEFRRRGLVFDVTDTGPPDGPVVVLLHGFPQFADSWSRVSERLVVQGFRCVAPNQRGYSPGARPRQRRAYRSSELVADVMALIDATGADRVHLVGHDWGAAVAWWVAARHPPRVASLAALSVPHPSAFTRAVLTSRQFFASWYMYAFQLPFLPELMVLGRERQRTDRLALMLRAAGRSRQGAQHDAEAMVSSGAFEAAVNWYRAIPFIDPGSLRRKISVPTLFLWSDGDAAVLRKSAQLCRDWVTGPYRFEVLRGESHWMPDQAPDAVSNLLLEHLAGA